MYFTFSMVYLRRNWTDSRPDKELKNIWDEMPGPPMDGSRRGGERGVRPLHDAAEKKSATEFKSLKKNATEKKKEECDKKKRKKNATEKKSPTEFSHWSESEGRDSVGSPEPITPLDSP